MVTSYLIPYACGTGAQDKACADGPAYLNKIGLVELLKTKRIATEWLQTIQPKDKSNITAYCETLRNNVQKVLQRGGFPITIGGDHSMAIGTWCGVASTINPKSKLGLIWIDAHMDAHTVQTTQTGNRHGMPISYLLGCGDDELAKVCNNLQVISPDRLCLVGIRSFEPEEAALLKNLGVRIITMDEVKKRGLEDVMLEAVNIASATNTAEFGISIDVDAFDPSIAPGTGTTEKGGLFIEEFRHAMHYSLKKESGLLALEIAEYNPHLDKRDITANLIVDIIAAVAHKHTQS